MDISSIVQNIENVIGQPYQNMAAHYEELQILIDDIINDQFVSAKNKSELEGLRERLLQNKDFSQIPSFLGSSARNII